MSSKAYRNQASGSTNNPLGLDTSLRSYSTGAGLVLFSMLPQLLCAPVGYFLEHTLSEHLSITDFAFHSIGVILSRLNRLEVLLRFVQDAFIDGAIALIHLEPGDTERLAHIAEQFNLDFDDAYQYVAAEKYDLALVSFDSDFDHTERGRKTPAEVLHR